MYCVYKHTNKINNKIYIGQTCQKPEYRWGSDGQNYKNNPYFYSAIIKYGWNNFTHEIIYNNLTAEEANQKEIELIKLYNSTDRNYGYNSESGGKNKVPNQETRNKQSDSARKRPIVKEETKQKLSKIGRNKKRSENTKNKLSKSAKEREQNKVYPKERPVKCVNTGTIFSSCREAADWCGLVGTSGIASVCRNGRQKTAGVHPETQEKLTWQYI